MPGVFCLNFLIGKKVKKNYISGGAAVLFGLLIALGPQFLFKVCEAHGGDHYSFCYWAARGELAAGFLIAAMGIFIILFSNLKVQMGISISIFLAVIVAGLIPYRVFFGVCANESMRCNKVTLPALTIICALSLIGVIINVIYLEKKTRS